MCEIFFLSWQSFLRLVFHSQADEDKCSLCWSRVEAETTEPCSWGSSRAPRLPGGLNPVNTTLTQFVPRLADVKGFEDPPFDLAWCFAPRLAKAYGMCWSDNPTRELCLGIVQVGEETSCVVLYSPTCLLSSLLLVGGNRFCCAKVPGNTARFL